MHSYPVRRLSPKSFTSCFPTDLSIRGGNCKIGINLNFSYDRDWVSAAPNTYKTNAGLVEWTDWLISGTRTGGLPILDYQRASRINCLFSGHGEVNWESESVCSFLPSLNKYLLSTHQVPLFQASFQIPVLSPLFFFEGLISTIFTTYHFLIFKRRLISVLIVS